MVKVRIWTKDAVEPIQYIVEGISFVGGFVVLTEDMIHSMYVPIEMIRIMERIAIQAENIVEIPEAWGGPVRSGAVIEKAKLPKGKKKEKK